MSTQAAEMEMIPHTVEPHPVTVSQPTRCGGDVAHAGDPVERDQMGRRFANPFVRCGRFHVKAISD